MTRFLALAMLVLQAGPRPTADAPLGVITVNVVDEQGSPLMDATVWMLPTGGSARLNPVPECLTDGTGTCTCAHLPVGQYLITAMKEADEYPNGEAPLFNRNRAHLVAEILPDKLNAHVSYRAGPRAAVILLSVVDSATGAQVRNPTVVLRNPTDANVWMSTGPDSKSRVLIPADEDVLMEVSAEGYKPVQIETEQGGTQANALHLRSEESRSLSVRLVPGSNK